MIKNSWYYIVIVVAVIFILHAVLITMKNSTTSNSNLDNKELVYKLKLDSLQDTLNALNIAYLTQKDILKKQLKNDSINKANIKNHEATYKPNNYSIISLDSNASILTEYLSGF